MRRLHAIAQCLGFKNCAIESEFFTAISWNFRRLRLDAPFSYFLVDILIKI